MKHFFSLENQVAVVTGGVSGIGRKTVERFVAAGAKVVVADIADGADFANAIDVEFVACDVTDERQVAAALQLAMDRFGTLDILVNNAGVFSGYGKLADKDASDFDHCFKVNVLGVSFGIKFAARLMRDGGRIINTASAAGLIGVSGLSDYVASKHSVVGLTRAAALELADRGIRVNCICPTTVNTPMAYQQGGEHMLAAERLLLPLGRICEPEEVAAVIHFLASEDCGFITGQAIAVDGGLSAGGSDRLYEKLMQ